MNQFVTTKDGNREFVADAELAPARDSRALPLVRQAVRIAHRWRFVVMGSVAACLVLGLIVTLLMTPKYTAYATIEISRESDRVTNFQGVERETSVADQEFYQTQYGLLRSRSLAERVATQMRLVDDPQFYELFGGLGDSPAFEQVNGRFTAAGRASRTRIAGEILLDNVSIDPTRLSRLVNIGFTSPDAEFSARVAGVWADSFIRTNLDRKIQATSYGRDLLQKQLAEYKARLDESQRQLVNYASSQQIINLPGQVTGDGRTTGERSIVAEELQALNSALGQARAERIRAASRVEQISSGGSTPEALRNQALNEIREQRALLSAQYEHMMTQFEPGYPAAVALQNQINELDRAIAQEETRISRSMQLEYNQAQAREQALEARVAALKNDFIDLRRRSIQYNIYQQEVDTNRALYDGLLQRFKEIGVAGGVGVNNVVVVDPADVPQEPSSPILLLNLALSIFAGLGLGSALALILEQIDEAIANPAELEDRLGLPLLGTVPKVDKDQPREALLDRKSDLFDAYLAVQTNLSFATEQGIPRSFAVTSTRPAEGKSTTALSLATTLARAGKRVILVDGDMRSPSVHLLGGVGHEIGLSNYLSGQDGIQSLVFHMEDLGFDAMSAGPIPPNAAELLTGKRFPELIDLLLQSYDHVVVDSPPVMGLADAPLIASAVEGVIYAVESHGIQSTAVKTALSRLDSAKIRVFGAVLTKFVAAKSDYGYVYGYEYGEHAGDEKAAT